MIWGTKIKILCSGFQWLVVNVVVSFDGALVGFPMVSLSFAFTILILDLFDNMLLPDYICIAVFSSLVQRRILFRSSWISCHLKSLDPHVLLSLSLSVGQRYVSSSMIRYILILSILVSNWWTDCLRSSGTSILFTVSGSLYFNSSLMTSD